jgi:hypothetical protein
MLAGPIDLDELDQWMRTGSERRRGSTVPYAGPTSQHGQPDQLACMMVRSVTSRE